MPQSEVSQPHDRRFKWSRESCWGQMRDKAQDHSHWSLDWLSTNCSFLRHLNYTDQCFLLSFHLHFSFISRLCSIVSWHLSLWTSSPAETTPPHQTCITVSNSPPNFCASNYYYVYWHLSSIPKMLIPLKHSPPVFLFLVSGSTFNCVAWALHSWLMHNPCLSHATCAIQQTNIKHEFEREYVQKE